MTRCQLKSLNDVLMVLGLAPREQDIRISGLALDSRRLIGGELFLAVPGFSVDGRDFAERAASSGAAVILAESGGTLPDSFAGSSAGPFAGKRVPVISVAGLKSKIGFLADRFYRQPSQKLNLVGVTGTNGKTSCCWFVAQLLSKLGQPCAVMGTLGKGIPPELEPSLNTTSDAVSVQQYLSVLVAGGVPAMAMEVSSHGLDQGRTDGLNFNIGVFTNISRDHLDYHKTLEAYALAKSKLFAGGRVNHAVINLDDDFSELMLSSCSEQTEVVTFSTRNADAGVFAEDIKLHQEGVSARVHTPWGTGELQTPQLGRFSLENLLAVVGVLCLQGYSLESVLALIPTLSTVPGRMQKLGGAGKPLVVVDYAHTPDALASVLGALREHGASKLICVFGCGGDRDRGKRPLMTRAAMKHADEVIVTSDNPRSESPERIIADALEGISSGEKERINTVVDRSDAIQVAISSATAGDIIVVAGKGHEDYQEIKGQRLPFDDRQQVVQALDGWVGVESGKSAVAGGIL